MVKHMVGANGQRLGHPFLVKGGRHIGRFWFQRGGHAFRDRSSPKWSKRWSNGKKAARRANCDQVFDHFCNGQTPDREIFDQVFDHVFRCGGYVAIEEERGGGQSGR